MGPGWISLFTAINDAPEDVQFRKVLPALRVRSSICQRVCARARSAMTASLSEQKDSWAHAVKRTRALGSP